MPAQKPLILFNPSAGMGRAARHGERLASLLRSARLAHELVPTESEDQLRALARRAARSGRAIVGAGGDTTFHIIVNEIMASGGRSAFGMLGLGSSNDITLAFGLEPLERAVAALKAGRNKRVDLGRISQGSRPLRFFLGQANIGLGAVVNDHVARLARRSPWLARRQKLAGTLGVLDAFRKSRVPVLLRVRAGGETFQGPFAAAVFSNTRFWATGKLIAPRARPDDGRLDACLIGKCTLLRLIRINALASRGRHERVREVRILQGREFFVTAGSPLLVQADGELLTLSSSAPEKAAVRFHAVPRVLRLIS